MRISDWSSDVCSSDLHVPGHHRSRSRDLVDEARYLRARDRVGKTITEVWKDMPGEYPLDLTDRPPIRFGGFIVGPHSANRQRSEERRVGKEGGSTCRSRWSRYH